MNQPIKIDPFGFREYDARWIYEKILTSKDHDPKGLEIQIREHTKRKSKSNSRHDYRSYSEKNNVKKGLVSTDVSLKMLAYLYHQWFILHNSI